MEDSNFQQFLKVLDDIELRNAEEIEDDGQAVGETTSVSEPHARRHKARCIPPESDLPPIKARPTSRKVARGVLRQPGFVYRTKNLTRSTYLDNNLWEYTCRRRVLKSPSFKHRQTRKSALGPYSTLVMDGLNGLSIGVGSKSCQTTKPSPPNPLSWLQSNPCNPTPNNNPTMSNIKRFLPLSTTVRFTSISTSKINSNFRPKQLLIQPGKLRLLDPNTDREKAPAAQQSSPPSKADTWSTTGLCASFSDVPHTSKNGVFENAIWDENEGVKNTFHKIRNGRSSEKNLNRRKTAKKLDKSCSYQARMSEHDVSVDELSSYVEDFLVLPQKMSSMAEMMYT